MTPFVAEPTLTWVADARSFGDGAFEGWIAVQDDVSFSCNVRLDANSSVETRWTAWREYGVSPDISTLSFPAAALRSFLDEIHVSPLKAELVLDELHVLARALEASVRARFLILIAAMEPGADAVTAQILELAEKGVR